FPGLMNRDYEIITSRATNEINHYDGTGTATSIAANRVSFTFNLTGPSLTVDTACSSFLFALHYALRALKSGDCEAAICGGVNCIIDPRTFVALSKAKMISPEGISKPFSKKADGYGRGEGCGVVFLKPLKKVRLLAKQLEISLVVCLNFVSSALIMTIPEKFFQFKFNFNEAILKNLCTFPSIGKGFHI
ncbi:ACTS3 synthase, partial [Alaudala cheleensis]|nr:ACTS3 synthase [Alaudala cheleensis]